MVKVVVNNKFECEHPRQVFEQNHNKTFGTIVAAEVDDIRVPLFMPLLIGKPQKIHIITTNEKSDIVCTWLGNWMVFPKVTKGEHQRCMSIEGEIYDFETMAQKVHTFEDATFRNFLQEEKNLYMKTKSEAIKLAVAVFEQLPNVLKPGTIVTKLSLLGDYQARVKEISFDSSGRLIQISFEHVFANGNIMSWKVENVVIRKFKGERTFESLGIKLMSDSDIQKIEAQKTKWGDWLSPHIDGTFQYNGNMEILDQSFIPFITKGTSPVLISYHCAQTDERYPEAIANSYPIILVSEIRKMLLLNEDKWMLGSISNLTAVQFTDNFHFIFCHRKQEIAQDLFRSINEQLPCVVLFHCSDHTSLNAFASHVQSTIYLFSGNSANTENRLKSYLDICKKHDLIPTIYNAQEIGYIKSLVDILVNYRGPIFLYISEDNNVNSLLLQNVTHTVRDQVNNYRKMYNDYRGG